MQPKQTTGERTWPLLGRLVVGQSRQWSAINYRDSHPH